MYKRRMAIKTVVGTKWAKQRVVFGGVRLVDSGLGAGAVRTVQRSGKGVWRTRRFNRAQHAWVQNEAVRQMMGRNTKQTKHGN